MHGKTLRDVADDMGLSKDRVRQIEAAALDSIRRRVRLPAKPVLLN
jgi:DNA-directed RNA polymerase sigma subunit (sigma70/sigma32)